MKMFVVCVSLLVFLFVPATSADCPRDNITVIEVPVGTAIFVGGTCGEIPKERIRILLVSKKTRTVSRYEMTIVNAKYLTLHDRLGTESDDKSGVLEKRGDKYFYAVFN